MVASKTGAAGLRLRNSIRAEAQLAGTSGRFLFPVSCRSISDRLFCKRQRTVSVDGVVGDPQDIARTDQAVLDLFPEMTRARWIQEGPGPLAFQGCGTESACSVRRTRRAGLRVQRTCRVGRVSPIVIGRDQPRSGCRSRVPYSRTESMLDGSDAIRRLALLNALVKRRGGEWGRLHHGGGVGIVADPCRSGVRR